MPPKNENPERPKIPNIYDDYEEYTPVLHGAGVGRGDGGARTGSRTRRPGQGAHRTETLDRLEENIKKDAGIGGMLESSWMSIKDCKEKLQNKGWPISDRNKKRWIDN